MSDKNLNPVDSLLIHGYVITMNSEKQIIKDGAIAIKNGKIEAVGSTSEIINKFYSNTTKDLHGNVVHPGLIDAHEHSMARLVGGWYPDYFTENQYYHTIMVPYTKERTAEDEYYSAMLACIEMLLNGTTAFGDTGSSKYLEQVMEAIKTVGIRGRAGYGIGDNTDGLLNDLNYSTKECLKKLEYQITKYPINSDSLAGCWVGLYGMGRCSDTLLKEAKKLANNYGTILNMHQSVFVDEVNNYIKQINGKRPIEHLYSLGILDSKTSLVHMINLSIEEVEILAETKSCVVHCPGASIRHGLGASVKGFFPEMIKKGIPVALGTDEANGSDALDLFRMIYLAATIHKEARCDTSIISAETAFEMATINGAKAMGMDDKIGSLEVGKRADIVIHNKYYPESYISLDPLNNLVFSSLSKSVDTVIIDGVTVVENKKLTTVDAQEIYKKVEQIASRLAKKIDFSAKRKWPIIN